MLEVKPLAGQPLPAHDEVDGAVAMGGPMSVDDVERFPALAAERDWLAEAVGRRMPVLGICLGAQLLARALGAEVRPGERPEIGFAHGRGPRPRRPGDRCTRAERRPSFTGTATSSTFPTGPGRLASSAVTEHQAFRLGNAWGVLFHPEADVAMVEAWLEVPEMVMDAGRVLGLGAAGLPSARPRSSRADLAATHRPRLPCLRRTRRRAR